MKSSTRCLYKPPRGLIAFFALLALLAILASACDKSSTKTQATLEVQSTLDAGKTATENAQQNVDATQSALIASPTSQSDFSAAEAQLSTQIALQGTQIAGQATQLAQRTAAIMTETTVRTIPTNTPTPQQQVQLTPLILTDWRLYFFNKVLAGCYLEGQDCWAANDSPLHNSRYGGFNLTMTTRESIYIDPSWPNPYLVFWHTYRSDKSLDVVCVVDSRKDILWHYGGSVGNWKWDQVAVSLSKYIGQNVTIMFDAAGRNSGFKRTWPRPPKTQWRIQDVKIVPDYQP